MELALVLIVLILAVGFDFTNGFHDAANAIATVVSTRTLPPKVALLMAAVMNLVGALLGTEVAETIANSILSLDDTPMNLHLLILLGALIGAISWNLITWAFGLPSSSSHALIGGLAGSGAVAMLFNSQVQVQWRSIVEKVIYPMLTSPLVGFVLAFFLMTLVRFLLRNASAAKTFPRFRILQIISSSAMALGHGLQDAQKTMGIMFLAATAVNWVDPAQGIPLWVKLLAASAISLGTYSGGWRIMKTLGRKIIDLDVSQGFVAEMTGASVLYVTAFFMHAPISTTHTITAAVMGVGATKGAKAVRWSTAQNIVGAWVLTLPASAAMGALSFGLLHLVLPL
ncbi:MAG: inorganic phosphate transporter [Bifidobacteriaceae bacterium]|jgi:PiT family inorganic phosphate transporter|nr:inorganic phosphate transporter [Bifidobacteriaceae bacterium]